MFLGALLNFLPLILPVLHAPRILSPWQPLGIPGQFLPMDSFFSSSNLGGLGLFLSSLCFMGSKACPFMDFGLQVFWACHPFFFFFVVGLTFLILLSMKLAHCAIFGPWRYDFLDLNRLVYHPTFHIWLKVYII